VGSWLPAWCRPVTSRNCALKRPIASRRDTKAFIQEFVGKGIAENLLREQFLFTPSCGMGTLSESDTAIVLKLLAATQTF
jgi:hypothetical protein